MSSLPLAQNSLGLAANLARLGDLADAASARVSSGRRLDRPSTDPAAVGQVSRLDGESTRLRAVEINLQNGVSRLQATTGQLDVLGRLTTRLSELASLAADPIRSPADTASYATEFTQLQTQLRQIIGGTSAEIGGSGVASAQGAFNQQELFGPAAGDTLVIGEAPPARYQPPVLNLRTGALGDLIRQDASGAFTLQLDASTAPAITRGLQAATTQIADAQAQVGAGLSRLDFAASVATTAATNHEAALSAIRDTDLATELTALSRYKILNESHTAMLAQARDASAKLLPLLARR